MFLYSRSFNFFFVLITFRIKRYKNKVCFYLQNHLILFVLITFRIKRYKKN